jgi:MoaA/NifB/PqqE/SkfB family radical SAM enzyme
MESYAINVINSINVNPDNNTHVQEMKKYIQDPDAFHGYMNNFVYFYKDDLSTTTKNFIRQYNDKYNVWSKEQTMLQMANHFDSEQISDLFDGFDISPNMDSLSKGISKTNISKRNRPSKKKKTLK